MTSVPTPAPATKPKVNWLWPKITDLTVAKEAAKGTFYAGLLVAGITLAFVIISMVQQNASIFLSPLAIIDVVAFAAIAIGGKLYVRAAGIAGPVLFALEKIYGFTQGMVPGAGGMVFAVVLFLLFITGARGILAVHRFGGAKA
jgi:hypothetical protein